MKTLLKTLLITCVAICAGTVAYAQGQSANANIPANANVIAQLNVTAGNALGFGDVSPGVSKSVAISDATAGTFSVTGGGGASVSLGFTLPTNLTSGANNLPIAFSTTDANWEDGISSLGTNVFDPNAGVSVGALPADGDMTVFIGGTVNPTNGQAAGTYTGTITLTATYN